MASLSNLSRYLGIYEHWKQIMRNYGLKWERISSLDAVINLLSTNLEDVKDWLKSVIQKIPKEFAVVEVFAVLTGLRPSEACMSTSLISELSTQNELEQYLNKDLLMLQHFRFKEKFLRRNKNAYISFISQELLDLIIEVEPKVTYSQLQKKIYRLDLKNRTRQLRKLNATLLRETLPREVIVLLQGRINQSVFLRYYYKPFLKDIRDRILKGIQPLQKELLEILS